MRRIQWRGRGGKDKRRLRRRGVERWGRLSHVWCDRRRSRRQVRRGRGVAHLSPVAHRRLHSSNRPRRTSTPQ